MSDDKILISVNDLEPRVGLAGTAIVDARFDLSDAAAGRRSYEEGHIPGAVFLDLDEDLAAPIGPTTGRHPLPDVVTITSTLGRLGIGNDTDIVVYDSGNGAIAARTWWILRWLGHKRVRLLDGGLSAWRDAGNRLEAGIAAPTATQFCGDPRSELVLTTAELAADIPGIAHRKLLDARDAARYRGEIEPIDPVAGHVPGAINLPFSDLVHSDGTWRPVEELRARFERALGENRNQPWAAMCGSGVTACHVAIGGLLAGYNEPRVYVGSWSEWIRDPERPTRPITA